MVEALYQLADMQRPAKVSELEGLTRGVFADFTKLKYWDLIKTIPDSEKWEVTDKGKEFLFHEGEIEKYRFIFNNTIQPTPEGMKNPLIKVTNISHEFISRQIVRRHSYPVGQEKQKTFF